MTDAPLLSWVNSPQDAIMRTLEVLRAGGVVAIPTETVYGLATAHAPAGAGRLDRIKGRSGGKPYTLAVADLDAARRLVPSFSPAARILGERYWPGPLTLVLPLDGCVTTGLRVPSGECARAILAAWGGPLLLTSANRAGAPPAIDATSVARTIGGQIDLIVDGGPTAIKEASAVVRICGGGLEVMRTGLIDRDMICGSAGIRVLFVCTGNTCRSPMAQAILTGLLARVLGVEPARLHERGIEVESAGVAAHLGSPISPEALAVLESRDWPISRHRTARPLDLEGVDRATRLYVMTRSHRDELVRHFPQALDRTHLVDRRGGEVADPIGSPLVRYAACADELERHLRPVAQDILEHFGVSSTLEAPPSGG